MIFSLITVQSLCKYVNLSHTVVILQLYACNPTSISRSLYFHDFLLTPFFNFRYGCTTCLVPGSYNHLYRKMLFPLDHDNHGFRSSTSYAAQLRRATSSLPVKGVKGATELSKLINLPDCLSFDIMHLIYHGVTKSFVSAMLVKKLIDVIDLSSLIEGFKVPHHFRRKPRNVITDFAMWKSQEHKNFLLYIGPIALFLLSSGPRSGNIFSVFYSLAVAIYIMSDEQVRLSDLPHCDSLIRNFQEGIVQLFGPSVRTMTTHALSHLSEQVRRMGPLSATSCSTFENLNRVLKQSVSGSRGQGHQMILRFLRQQQLPSVDSNDSTAHPRGRLNSLTEEMSHVCQFVSSSIDGYVNRFSVHSLTFHSYHYGRYLKCASYYAFLACKNSFVKIKFIIVSGENIYCICRDFEKENVLSRDIAVSTSFSDDILKSLDALPTYYIMKKGDRTCYPATFFTHHAIVYKRGDKYYGVKIQNNFEHE